MGKICDFCNTDNADNAHFCKNCGKEMSVKTLTICPKCGEKIEENSSFCRNCGYEFKYKVDGNVVSAHDYVKNSYDKLQAKDEKIHNSFIKIALIIGIIMSVIFVIYFYNDMGLFSLIFPVIIIGAIGIAYIQEKIHMKIKFGAGNALNDIINKKR